MSTKTFANQLRAWQRAQDKSDNIPVVASHGAKAVHNPHLHHKPLHRYCAIVEFPLSKGGGYSYYKNPAAVRALEAKAGYVVTWLNKA